MIVGSRETTASLSRLADGSLESASTTAQNLGMARSASFASCSAGDRGAEDGVEVAVVLVAEVIVERLGLGSFVAQADVAVIAARASVAAIRLLVLVICGTPRDLSMPKAVCGVRAVNLKQIRCIYTSAFKSTRLGLSTRSCPMAGGPSDATPRSPAASDPLRESYRPRR